MPKKYRKNIPKAVKDRLWDMTFGPSAGNGKCHTCDATINSKRFEAGHIISVYDGGKDTINNLRCICSTCNKSMGVENMDDFKKRYFEKKEIKQLEHEEIIEDDDILKINLKNLDKFLYKKI